MNHFWEVCRSARGRAVHNIEQEPDQEEENHIDTVNINSINFNSNHSVITANLKTSSNKVIITVLHKVDTCTDGNILPFHIYKSYFLGQQKSSWQQQGVQICNYQHVTEQQQHN